MGLTESHEPRTLDFRFHIFDNLANGIVVWRPESEGFRVDDEEGNFDSREGIGRGGRNVLEEGVDPGVESHSPHEGEGRGAFSEDLDWWKER